MRNSPCVRRKQSAHARQLVHRPAVTFGWWLNIRSCEGISLTNNMKPRGSHGAMVAFWFYYKPSRFLESGFVLVTDLVLWQNTREPLLELGWNWPSHKAKCAQVDFSILHSPNDLVSTVSILFISPTSHLRFRQTLNCEPWYSQKHLEILNIHSHSQNV